MAHIAIDMTCTPRNKTGIGRYIKNLVEALQKEDTSNEYFLFTHSDDLDGFEITAPNFHFVPVNSRILRKTYIRILWEQFVLPFRLAKLKIDIILCPNFTMPYFSPVKKVVAFHDLTYFFMPEMHTPLKREMFKMYIRLSARASSAIIAISENTITDIKKYFPNTDRKIFLTPLGVAPNFYAFKNRQVDTINLQDNYNLPSDYILYVGTIEPRKNVINLIKGYELLPAETKERYKLVLCGKKGWLYEDLFAYYEKSSDKDNIIFSGFITDEDLPYLYHQAAVFAYVSHYEGFGIPLIESMACDTPLITSNTSSMKEIAHGAALLIHPEKPDEIAAAIQKLIHDPIMQEQFKVQYPAKLSYYNWSNCAKTTIKAFESLL